MNIFTFQLIVTKPQLIIIVAPEEGDRCVSEISKNKVFSLCPLTSILLIYSNFLLIIDTKSQD